MRKLILVLSALILTPSSMPATAGSATGGYVTGFATLNNGTMLVFTDGNRTNIPGCSNTNFPNRWAFNMTTPLGQGMLSLLLTAKAQREPISLYGDDTCSVQSDSETIVAVVTNNLQ